MRSPQKRQSLRYPRPSSHEKRCVATRNVLSPITSRTCFAQPKTSVQPPMAQAPLPFLTRTRLARARARGKTKNPPCAYTRGAHAHVRACARSTRIEQPQRDRSCLWPLPWEPLAYVLPLYSGDRQPRNLRSQCCSRKCLTAQNGTQEAISPARRSSGRDATRKRSSGAAPTRYGPRIRYD